MRLQILLACIFLGSNTEAHATANFTLKNKPNLLQLQRNSDQTNFEQFYATVAVSKTITAERQFSAVVSLLESRAPVTFNFTTVCEDEILVSDFYREITLESNQTEIVSFKADQNASNCDFNRTLAGAFASYPWKDNTPFQTEQLLVHVEKPMPQHKMFLQIDTPSHYPPGSSIRYRVYLLDNQIRVPAPKNSSQHQLKVDFLDYSQESILTEKILLNLTDSGFFSGSVTPTKKLLNISVETLSLRENIKLTRSFKYDPQPDLASESQNSFTSKIKLDTDYVFVSDPELKANISLLLNNVIPIGGICDINIDWPKRLLADKLTGYQVTVNNETGKGHVKLNVLKGVQLNSDYRNQLRRGIRMFVAGKCVNSEIQANSPYLFIHKPFILYIANYTVHLLSSNLKHNGTRDITLMTLVIQVRKTDSSSFEENKLQDKLKATLLLPEGLTKKLVNPQETIFSSLVPRDGIVVLNIPFKNLSEIDFTLKNSFVQIEVGDVREITRLSFSYEPACGFLRVFMEEPDTRI